MGCLISDCRSNLRGFKNLAGLFSQSNVQDADEYNIYNRLGERGFRHKMVNHSDNEYARDEDKDGFCGIHSNSIKGFWSLLRPWLHPYRGIFQDKLPLYLSFFEFIYNTKKRGKRLLASLLETLLKKTLEPI